MHDPTETKELLERARAGDAEAVEMLLDPLRESLLATIRRRLSPAIRQRIDAEDVLQDTCIRALHSIDRFEWRGEGSFERWMETIATHVALDVVRRQGRRPALRIEREPAAEGAPPSRDLRRIERRERLDRAMETLSPEYRTVLELSRVQGLPIREVAERMDRTEPSVKNLLLRATRALRDAFGDTRSLGLALQHPIDRRTGDGQ